MLKEAFLNIEEKIEEELECSRNGKNQNNENNWLDCFTSQSTVVTGRLYCAHQELDKKQQRFADKKIEQLNQRLRKLNQEYQGKNAVIPDKIKRELLEFLTLKNILGE